jgi:hypothetical protein
VILSNPNKLEGTFRISENNGINFISHGKIFFEDGSYYSGELKNNIFHGLGKFTLADGSYYQGNFSSSIPNRLGKIMTPGYSYEGEFKKGVKHGYGIITFHPKEQNCGKGRNLN